MPTTTSTQYGCLYYVWNRKTGTYLSEPTTRPSLSISSTRSSAVKREKPVGEVALFLAGTSYNHELLEIRNDSIKYDEPSPSPYTVQMQLDQIPGFGWSQYETVNWDTTNPVNELKSKLLSKARDDGVNLATMLGEYRDTADLFCSLASDFVHLTTALKRKDPRHLIYGRYYSSGRLKCPWPKAIRKEAADRWLEYVWGVTPLINDMQQAWQDFRQTPLPPLYKVIHASTSRQDITSTSYPYNSSIVVNDYSVARATYSGRALAYYKDTLLSNTLARTGFTNPLAVAYELTPYSWLIDYWCNLGSVIQSLDSSLIFSSLNWNYTTRYNYLMRRTALDGVGSVLKRKTSRTATTILSSTPPLYYKESVTARHVMNVLAVLQGIRK